MPAGVFGINLQLKSYETVDFFARFVYNNSVITYIKEIFASEIGKNLLRMRYNLMRNEQQRCFCNLE